MCTVNSVVTSFLSTNCSYQAFKLISLTLYLTYVTLCLVCWHLPQVSDQSIGLYGKHVVSFQCMKPNEALPSTSISSGKILFYIHIALTKTIIMCQLSCPSSILIKDTHTFLTTCNRQHNTGCGHNVHGKICYYNLCVHNNYRWYNWSILKRQKCYWKNPIWSCFSDKTNFCISCVWWAAWHYRLEYLWWINSASQIVQWCHISKNKKV